MHASRRNAAVNIVKQIAFKVNIMIVGELFNDETQLQLQSVHTDFNFEVVDKYSTEQLKTKKW